MRICILTTSTTAHQMGGTEVHAETLAAEAARQGHAVFMLTTEHPRGLDREVKDGYTVVYLSGTRHTMSRREAPAWWAASRASAAELCSAEKIDVVWAENFSGLSYAALPAGERRPVISVVNGLAVRGEIASNFNRVSSAAELLYFLTRYAAQTIFYYIPWFRALVRDSDLLVGVSNETGEALAEEFPRSRAKTRVILNPVDTVKFRPDPALRAAARAELGIGASEPVLLMSGVIHKQKGMHLGIKAFSALAGKFPEARLLIIGDGPQRAELEMAAARAGLGRRVIFAGMRPNGEMPRYYNAADIYLNPTLRLEGLAIVILEAMACGLPCVVSKIGGTGSSIEDGKCGFFTAPGDVAALTERLEQLLTGKELRSKLGGAARDRAEKVFSIETAVRRYIEISRELLGGAA